MVVALYGACAAPAVLAPLQRLRVAGSGLTRVSSPFAAPQQQASLARRSSSCCRGRLQRLAARRGPPAVRCSAAGGGGGPDGGSGDKKPQKDDEKRSVSTAVRSDGDKSSGKDADELAKEEYMRIAELAVAGLLGPAKVDREDVNAFKEKYCGYTSFWVTGQEPYGDSGEGFLLKGNMRGKREEVFAKLKNGLQELYGDKYDLFMVPEPNAESDDPRGGPRVSFVVLTSEISRPPPTTGWQTFLAVFLVPFSLLTCIQVGITAQISKLPPDVVTFFTNADLDASAELPGDFDLLPLLNSAFRIALTVFSISIAHELGHRAVAATKKVKLSLPYFIPNALLGTFGAVTQFKSLLPNNTVVFDVSVAGPVVGGAVASAMFFYGLALSQTAGPDDLVGVPSVLFQGSLLLGSVTRFSLGAARMTGELVNIHPLVIAGWCGLTTTALNLLPLGALDGGRCAQAAFGKGETRVLSLITYALLGLGVVGGNLSLQWGLFVLFVQRVPEKVVQDDVSPAGNARRTLMVLLLAAAYLALLPIWPELADDLGIGPAQLL
eukprot:jgi/Chlat1/1091/Chrsp110S01587